MQGERERERELSQIRKRDEALGFSFYLYLKLQRQVQVQSSIFAFLDVGIYQTFSVESFVAPALPDRTKLFMPNFFFNSLLKGLHCRAVAKHTSKKLMPKRVQSNQPPL